MTPFHYFILFYLQKETFRKTNQKGRHFVSISWTLQAPTNAACRRPSESGHSCFVFPWKKRHKLLRRNFRYTHKPHATSQQHGATRMRYCSRLKREFHNHGLSLEQFSGLAFASRNWCLAPSLLCLIWVFSQGFAAGVHPKVLGFPHFNGFLINCLPVPQIWRGADFCALHADLCQWGDRCCALYHASIIYRSFRFWGVVPILIHSHDEVLCSCPLACQQQGYFFGCAFARGFPVALHGQLPFSNYVRYGSRRWVPPWLGPLLWFCEEKKLHAFGLESSLVWGSFDSYGRMDPKKRTGETWIR